ncbi:MAG TPA: hypothetical protein PKY82_02125 [Pyrinomonadaceae bacterium]|nr:hypothetical protein [Pyrinomonadaceae bacterium]
MSANNWKNRIVGEGEKSAKDFNFNPLNWRRHPEVQQKAIAEILGEVGWVQRVLINRTTGNVIDGHARIEEALKRGAETSVPFVEVELSIEEEQKILRLFDAVGAMAVPDLEKLRELNELIEFDSPVFAEILPNFEEIEVNMDEFFHSVAELPKENFNLRLSFSSEDDYRKVLDGLGAVAAKPEEAVKKLLNL